jgi:hypothetical protein
MKIHQTFIVGISAAAVMAASAGAQEPYPDYVLPGRLYHYYLTSPYSFRTYSSLGSARAWSYDTPYESGRFYQPPGYYHEEISPAGRWGSGIVPPVEGQITRRPVVVYAPVWPPPYPFPSPPP